MPKITNFYISFSLNHRQALFDVNYVLPCQGSRPQYANVHILRIIRTFSLCEEKFLYSLKINDISMYYRLICLHKF